MILVMEHNFAFTDVDSIVSSVMAHLLNRMLPCWSICIKYKINPPAGRHHKDRVGDNRY